jgi:diguanylate cyclase
VVFVACGGVCLARARAIAPERAAWGLIGAGLLLYACGSVVYNTDLASATVTFPSRADTLWLSLYPLSFAGMVALVRARHVQVTASLWLDAMIGASAVAAVAAVFVLPPVLELTSGSATAARVAYPLAGLILTGFAVVLWGAGRWRLDTWCALAAGFALIAIGDSAYVVAQAAGGWDPGSLADIPYIAGTILLAVAAWRSEPRRRDVPNARVALPIAFTVTAFALVSYEAFADLDVLAVVLIRLTLLAVVLRLGVTLCGCPVSVPISRRWRPRIR